MLFVWFCLLFYFYYYLVDKGTFSVGIDWKYSGKDDDDDDEYTVKPRYNSLKEEISHYNYLSRGEINKIFKKAKQYIKESTIAKSLTEYDDYDYDYDDDDDPKDNPITLDALICIIMYCDYSLLSRDFSLSFRKRNEFELISQIKKRNQKYYHWSKILKNTIDKYGQSHHLNKGLLSNMTDGPFYCGMSIVLNIPQFNMFIYCPLSTSNIMYYEHKYN